MRRRNEIVQFPVRQKIPDPDYASAFLLREEGDINSVLLQKRICWPRAAHIEPRPRTRRQDSFPGTQDDMAAPVDKILRILIC